jgi:hypothetical protein
MRKRTARSRVSIAKVRVRGPKKKRVPSERCLRYLALIQPLQPIAPEDVPRDGWESAEQLQALGEALEGKWVLCPQDDRRRVGRKTVKWARVSLSKKGLKALEMQDVASSEG